METGMWGCLGQTTYYTFTATCVSSPRPRGNIVYLVVSAKAISDVLIKEIFEEHGPIYFISKALQGLETRYQKIKKLALTIIMEV